MSDPPALGFSYRATRGGEVHISREGRTVTTLRGPAASKFLSKVTSMDDAAAQQLMARATGNYRRGNERQTTRRANRP